MFCNVLNITHNAITLLFGVYISAAFLGILMNRRNILILLAFSACVGAVNAAVFALFGAAFTEKIYPLIIHIPLVLFLTLFYKYKAILCALSVLTAYLCCQISNWIGLLFLTITHLEWVYYIARIATTITVFIVLIMFVSEATAQLMQKPTKTLLIFGMLPFIYYLFDYSAGVYTSLLYSGTEVIVEFLAFAICVFYIIFLLVYFKQYEEKQEAEQRNRLIKMQRTQSEKEIEAIKRSEYAISILRHDMRHFLLNISAYIDNNEIDKAKEYINEIISSTNQTATQKYCKNEIVNMILSSHENKIRENDIHFQHSIQLPQELPISDVNLTSILSNALENAILAVLPLEKERREIKLDLHMNDHKLLISIKNTFAQMPEIADGLPKSSTPGHGLGTQSIRYVTEKLNGNCQFMIKDQWFILRVII